MKTSIIIPITIRKNTPNTVWKIMCQDHFSYFSAPAFKKLKHAL